MLCRCRAISLRREKAENSAGNCAPALTDKSDMEAPMKAVNYTGTRHGGQETEQAFMPSIKVVGVGGGGKNSINRLMQSNLANLDFIAANTDAKSLKESKACIKILLGAEMPGLMGFGSGGRPGLARKAANLAKTEIAEALEGAEMVLITATLGGGTGSGAAPVIASIAHEMGALVVAFVTRPFRFEGPRRARKARESVKNLKKYVDILFDFKNDVTAELPPETSMLEAFASIDSYFGEAIQCFIELLRPGLIDIGVLDLLDLAGGFCEGSIAVGRGSGEKMAGEAVETALADRTFKVNRSRVSVALMNVTSGPEMKTCDLSRLVSPVQAALGRESSLMYSHQVMNDMIGRIKATLVFLCPRSR